MTKILTEEECGLRFGTEVDFARLLVKGGGDPVSDVSINITGDKCAPLKLRFDRAGYNHWDDLYSYCFKLPSNEEFWVEMSGELSSEQRVKLLRNLMTW